MQKILLLGAVLLLAACAAPNQAPLPPAGPIPVADRYAFTKLDQKTCPTEAASYADWVERYEAFAYKGGQPKELIADAFENAKENPSITAKQSKQPEFVTPRLDLSFQGGVRRPRGARPAAICAEPRRGRRDGPAIRRRFPER